jgi:hypothetical protein
VGLDVSPVEIVASFVVGIGLVIVSAISIVAGG